MLTPRDVAEILGLSVITVKRWLHDGRMTGVKIGKYWRVREADLEAFIRSRTREAKDPADDPK